MRFADFVVHFEPAQDSEILARVLESAAGEGKQIFRLPASLQSHSELFREAIGHFSERNTKLASRIGQDLFQTLFSGQVLALYERSTGMLATEEKGCLRLVLRLDPTVRGLRNLYALPWELIQNPDTQQFLALSRDFSIVRHLAVPRPARTMPLPAPLRILVLSSSPRKFSEIDLDKERKALERALGTNPGIKLRILQNATVENFRKLLLSESFHVVHFIGHGSFSPKDGEGAVVFEDRDGQPSLVSGPRFATLLADSSTIRVVFLNACDTARATADDESNPFAGVATALVLGGIPAVVAMQFPISEKAALCFSRSFYSQLSDGDPIDSAVTEGRIALMVRQGGPIEWATPALFSRTPGGSVFAIQTRGSREVPDMKEAAETAIRSEFSASFAQKEKTQPEATSADHRERTGDAVNDEGSEVEPAEATEVESREEFDAQKAFDGAQESTHFVLRQIELAYEQTRSEARKWSTASLIAAGCGLIMVVATLVSLLAGSTEIGTISAIGSTVPTVIAGLFFTQTRGANKRLGSIVEDLSAARKVHFAQEIARTMETPIERDKAKNAIVVTLLGNSGEGREVVK